MKKTIYKLIAVIMVLALIAACTTQEKAPAPAAPAADSGAPSEPVTTDDKQEAEDASAEVVAPSGEPIVLGMVTEMQKEYSYYVRDGVQMALDEINAAGGVLGRPLEIVMEDEGPDQQGSINAMMKLLSQDHIVGILGSIQSPYCVAAVDLVDQAKVPTLMGGSSRKIVELGSDYIYLVRTIDKYNGANVAKLAAEVYNAERVAIVHMNDASGVSYSEAIAQTLIDKYGITPVLTLGYDEKTETNFNPYIIQVLNADADFMFFSGGTGPQILMQQASWNNGFEGKVFCSTPGVSAQAVEMSGEAANGWSAVSDYCSNTTDPTQLAFVEKYRKDHEFDPDFFAAEYYDMVYIFKEAIELAGKADRESINQGIKMIKNLQGAMSNYSFHEDHGLSNLVYVVTVIDGVPTVEDIVYTYE